MHAIRIHDQGGPEVLRYEEAPRPKAGKGELLIRVHAAGVNPLDLNERHDQLTKPFQRKFPRIPGSDLSGVVEKIGPRVSQFKKGDAVFSNPDASRDGAYAEYVVVRESEVAHKPRTLHHVYAAAVPLAGLTAWQGLFDIAHLKRGQRLLVLGGASGVGHVAVQLARWKGAYVIATASANNQQLLRDLGVDQPVDHAKQRFETVIKDIDVVLDTIGGDTQHRSWKVLKKAGVLVSTVQPPDSDKAKKAGVRGLFVSCQPDGKQLTAIAALIDSGKIKVIVDRILPLSEARRAHELSQSDDVRGRIVLRVKEIQL
jgi:NADPH:quinone reductase-like Zn-dependent oxidoreductase